MIYGRDGALDSPTPRTDKSVALMASKSVQSVRPFPLSSNSVHTLHSFVVNSIRRCRSPLAKSKIHDRYLCINWFRSARVYLLGYNVYCSRHTLLLDCGRCTLREPTAFSEVRHPLVRSVVCIPERGLCTKI